MSRAHVHRPETHGDRACRHHGFGLSSAPPRTLLVAFSLTLAMLIIEFVGAWWSGSLALLADAVHLLIDALALLLAFLGAWVAQRPVDARHTYGYGRSDVLAGFIGALAQCLLVGFIAWEALVRLLQWNRNHILSGVMLMVALLGLVFNLLVLRLLHGHAHDDVNMSAARLHVLGDLFGSLGAVLAALAVRYLGWNWSDPLLSLLVALLILHSAWRLLRQSAHILLEGVPDDVDCDEVTQTLLDASPVMTGIHHLHVWQLASGSRLATLHLELADAAQSAAMLVLIRQLLRDRYQIGHVTVQIDPGICPDEGMVCGNGGTV